MWSKVPAWCALHTWRCRWFSAHLPLPAEHLSRIRHWKQRRPAFPAGRGFDSEWLIIQAALLPLTWAFDANGLPAKLIFCRIQTPHPQIRFVSARACSCSLNTTWICDASPFPFPSVAVVGVQFLLSNWPNYLSLTRKSFPLAYHS